MRFEKTSAISNQYNTIIRFSSHQHLLLKFLLFVVLFGGMWQGLKASDTNDVVWSKNIGTEFGWVELGDAKLSPDGNTILISTRGGIKLVDTKTGNFIRDYTVPSENISIVSFYPDGSKFMVTCRDSNLFVVDFQSGAILAKLTHLEGGVLQADYNPTNQLIYSITFGEVKPIIYVWNAVNFKSSKTIDTKSGINIFSSFNTLDQKYAILETDFNVNTKNFDYFIKVIDLTSDTIIFRTLCSQVEVKDMKMSPDGKYIATAEVDSTAKIWDAKTGSLVYTFYPGRISKDYFVGSSYFSNDSKFLITGIFPLKFLIWNLETKEMIKQYEYGSWIGGITKDNKYILTFNNKMLILVNAKWEPEGILDNQKNQNTYPEISPNPTTNILELSFDLIKSANTTITLYNFNGNKISQLFDEFLLAGHQVKSFNLTNLNAGIYLCRIQSSDYLKILKLIKN